MKKYSLLVFCAVAIFLFGFTCLSSAEEAAAAPAVVIIEGSAFGPEVVTINTGGEVVWKNKDSVPHTVTADDGSFDSGTLGQGDEYKKRFTKPGTYKYSCDIHAYMSGRIVVE